MRAQPKLVLAALAATIVLAATAAASHGSRLSFNSRTFRVVWTPLTASETEGGGIEIECSVTFEGSLHTDVFTKVAGNLIGNVTRAISNTFSCLRGFIWMLNGTEVLPNGMTAPNTLPWAVRYTGFTGSLPSITGVGIELFVAKIMIGILPAPIVMCLYFTRSTGELVGKLNREAGGALTNMRINRTISMERSAGQPAACPERLFFGEEQGTIKQLNSTNSVTLRLI